jgi:hypothetical protein
MSRSNQRVLKAYLTGINQIACPEFGIELCARSPILTLCRKLPPTGRLEVYRDGTLALLVKDIGAAAGLTVREDPVRFAKYRLGFDSEAT